MSRTDGLSGEAEEWLDAITKGDGVEVPRGEWEVVEELVRLGLVRLGWGRGPGNDWKRATLVSNASPCEGVR